MNNDRLADIFRKAAEIALAEWHTDQWDRQKDELDDLSQDLWVWYLERPGTQKKFKNLSEPEAVETARIHAIQILSKQALTENTFQGRDLYSSESIKEALNGGTSNKYLNEILPIALDNLGRRNEVQAEAVRVRYTDGEHPDKDVLSRAVKSVTEEVNVIYLTSDDDGIGSRHKVFPETRHQKSGYSDPTGDTAVLLDSRPEYRVDFYGQTPISDFLQGAQAQPAVVLGKVGGKLVRYRRTRAC